MKILLLGATPPPVGGIAKWTMRMIQNQLPDNWETVLIDEKIIGRRGMFGDNTKKNLLNECIRWKRIWSSVWKETKEADIMVVHSCPIASTTSMLAEFVNCIISHIHKKRFIIHFRCTVPNMIKSSAQKKLLKLFCDHADAIIALNTQTKEYLVNITRTMCVVIPNFVEVSEINQSKAINETISTVLYVGGVIKEKGCDVIIDTSDAFPSVQFRLVGDSNKEIQEMARQHKNVILTGAKDKQGVIDELNHADIFVFLSRYIGEGFSNSLAEAMASGLPCIVTDWAANRDMIGESGGITLDKGSKEQLVDAILKMNGRDIRTQQSIRNMKKVREEYSDNVILKKYTELYNKLIV